MRLISYSGFKAALCALSLTVLSLGCTPKEDPINPGGGGGGSTTVAVTGVTLSQTSATLEIGGTVTLTATVTPANATDKTVSWSTSDAKVATVNGGKVTAVAEGSATITASAGGKSATCSVTVKKGTVAVTDITLSQTSATLDIGGTITLTATVAPSDATDKTVTWSTSDAKVATVEDGKVTAVAEGSATITATAGGKSATCSVTVKKGTVDVTDITLSQKSLTLEIGGTYMLHATVAPSDATDKTVTWSTSDAKVATVEDGKVTAVAAGSATITAAAGGKSATCSVTVNAATIEPTGITVDKDDVTIGVGESFTITATVLPENATDKTVTWDSSNPSVATVDANGMVTGVAPGNASIVAHSSNERTAICHVIVTASQTATKAALRKFYDAMDGPHWKIERKWDDSKSLSEWEGVDWNPTTGDLKLSFFGEFGLKGQVPDCIDELADYLTDLIIQDETGVTGTLPSSFSNLKRLTNFSLVNTSMSSLPDFFNGMSLEDVLITFNSKMTGQLPESLGTLGSLKSLSIGDNNFSGTVPDSWAQLGSKLRLRGELGLDTRVPDSFVSSQYASYLVNMYLTLTETADSPAPVQVGDYDIPAFWPDHDLKDLVTGKTISYKQIIAKNKVTVLLNWATWCPFSKELMPVLKRMYEKYHKDGLEIIAAFNSTEHQTDEGRPLKDIVQERGYDQWYNFNIHDFVGIEDCIWADATPSAILVDKNGNIMASSRMNVSDPSRNRFGYLASRFLIPLLEEQFGPLEGGGDYSSTDYSEDGKVITLQKASSGKGINLVFMGDAYTDKDIASGLYEQVMRQSMDQFFSIEPYKTYRNKFNVYAVKVVSKHGKTGTGYETALGTNFTNGQAGTGNEDKIYQYALKVSGISDKKNLTIGVIVNALTNGGITSMSESLQSGIGYYSSIGNDPDAFGSTLRHEVGGHGFGFLGDEYSNAGGSPTQAQIDEVKRLYTSYGWYANLDFTNDAKKVKWADFLSDSRYKDEVGIFEGGMNHTKGVYRPSENSMMRHQYEYFNAPSRWAIYKRIMELSGETPTFAKFLEYDAVNRGQQHNAPRRAAKYVEWKPDSAPVVRP